MWWWGSPGPQHCLFLSSGPSAIISKVTRACRQENTVVASANHGYILKKFSVDDTLVSHDGSRVVDTKSEH